MIKVGLVFGHVATNIGDQIINDGIFKILKKMDFEIDLHIVFFEPNVNLMSAIRDKIIKEKLGTFKVFNPLSKTRIPNKLYKYLIEPSRILEETGLISCDTILFNSGEHLFFNQDIENNYNLFWRLLPLYAAKLSGKKCILSPSTLGPFNSASFDDLLLNSLKSFDHLSYRESYTGEILRNEGIINGKELLDPAFLYFDKF